MKAARSSNTLAILATTAVFAGAAAAARPATAQDAAADLRWTPHRASLPADALTDASADASADESIGEPADRLPPSPPATVSLPDGVPAADATPWQQEAVSAPPIRQPRRNPAGPRPAEAGLPAAIGQIYDPTNPDSVLGFNILRTPRGPAGRPILAAEGRQAQAMQAQAMRDAADRRGGTDARLGGGLAPRYGSGRRDAAARPERLAMNADGIPSVMTRAPQVATADEPAGAGRGQPPAGGRLPAPTAADDPLPMEAESIGPGIELPGGLGADGYPDYPLDEGEVFGDGMAEPGSGGGLLMGEYPTQLHVESFYDDPYACDDEEGLLPMCQHDGRICAWLRRFGRPYYGWRWYRDFTASAGITGFTNATDFGLNGNFGTNEYLNWAMPFWNAFGIGWQVGWRGVQSNFRPSSIEIGTNTLTKNARDQNFLTTGFFTRAFEGRGLQGGIAYDYLHDSWFENTDLAQLRYELSYVWGYHEWGFWGASNITDQIGLFGNRRPQRTNTGVADTLSLYTGFYRLQFGDANEWKVWAGGTSEADGIIGTLVRAPMHKSLALEGTFTYVIPGRNQVIDIDRGGALTTFSPSAWNVSVNVVWYPAARSRRSLASPYRPLFEVADNGSMIRSVESLQP